MEDSIKLPGEGEAKEIASLIRKKITELEGKLKEIDEKKASLGENYKTATQTDSAGALLSDLENTENVIRGMLNEFENLAKIYESLNAEQIEGAVK